jgi:very-short-patch-repair endonuclease
MKCIMHWRDAEATIADIGGEHDGIVVWVAAVAAGLTQQDLDHNVADGRLVRLGRGVYRLRDHPLDVRSRCRAALALAGEGSALGLRTAARLHGCWAYRSFDGVEVVVERGRDHRTSIGRVVQTRSLPEDHVVVVDGLPVTSLARTFFDLCGDPDHRLPLRHPVHEQRMKQLYNDCVARRGLTFTKAVAVLLVLAKRGRRGTRLVRSLLKRYGPRHRPTQSDVETLFHDLVLDRGLPDPERQAVITGPHGWIGTVDFAWRRAKHIVEVDSSWHDGPYDEEVDLQRDADLRTAGYTVARYRYGQIVLSPDRLIRELGAAIEAGASIAAPRTGVGARTSEG